MNLKQALCYNLLSTITCFVGFVIGVLLGSIEAFLRYIFGFSGGMFLYIALSCMVGSMSSFSEYCAQKKLKILLIELCFRGSNVAKRHSLTFLHYFFSNVQHFLDEMFFFKLWCIFYRTLNEIMQITLSTGIWRLVKNRVKSCYFCLYFKCSRFTTFYSHDLSAFWHFIPSSRPVTVIWYDTAQLHGTVHARHRRFLQHLQFTVDARVCTWTNITSSWVWLVLSECWWPSVCS